MKNLKEKKKIKQKIFDEFTEYFFNFIFMAIIFSAIILYRRMVLAHHGIILHDYFLGVFKAFVIAKVVMIGAFLKISRVYENKPLIIPILYKAALFTISVMIFDIIEAFIIGLIHTKDLLEAIVAIETHLTLVWLGGAMLIFFIFIPFFAVKELIRVMGNDKVRALLFKNRTDL